MPLLVAQVGVVLVINNFKKICWHTRYKSKWLAYRSCDSTPQHMVVVSHEGHELSVVFSRRHVTGRLPTLVSTHFYEDIRCSLKDWLKQNVKVSGINLADCNAPSFDRNAWRHEYISWFKSKNIWNSSNIQCRTCGCQVGIDVGNLTSSQIQCELFFAEIEDLICEQPPSVSERFLSMSQFPLVLRFHFAIVCQMQEFCILKKRL